ncbi:MAG: glutathione ABC transporter permease [Candidatus Binatia bacterium]|nr:MAG: glutathione ABC transporter permease [Candidatus Binatia bacterium]
MTSLFIRKLLSSVIVFFGVTFLTFTLTLLVPGDPAVAIAGPKASPAVVREIREQLGLDRPVLIQYLRYLGRLLQGDLGRSYVTREPVTQSIRQRLPATALLAVVAWILGGSLGVLLGCLPALYPRAAPWVFAGCTVGLALPAFWLGLLLLYCGAYVIPVFPLGGYSGAGVVLPACALGAGLAANYARIVMARLEDAMRSDFVRTARAKGVPRSRIVFRHALRDVLLTVVTLLGLDLASLLGGVTLTETVFNWPGIGRLAVEAVFNQDLPTLMGTVVCATLFVVLANLIVDACYAWIDPRTRTES